MNDRKVIYQYIKFMLLIPLTISTVFYLGFFIGANFLENPFVQDFIITIPILMFLSFLHVITSPIAWILLLIVFIIKTIINTKSYCKRN